MRTALHLYSQALLPIALLVIFGCSDLVQVERENARPLDPLPVYATWWDEMSACSGRSGDMARIRWWQASSIRSNTQIVRGQWESPHRITIVSFFVDDPDVVKHEMLHDLLDGDPEHVAPQWDVCGVRGP